MSSTLANCLSPNPDISGIGVRAATYAQNLLSFVTTFYALADKIVSEGELTSLETQSTTILITAFAILISTIIQASTTAGLTNFDATVILNLSWMNNTNTFIYLLLFVHRKASCAPQHARKKPLWRFLLSYHKQDL
ncbi:hypothetical protein BT96DRAFT_866449, partial [Gymnopus androsaceus JB14]